MLSTDWTEIIDDTATKFVDHELAWMPHDRHGRWLVLEAGAGRLLREHPEHIRQIVDAVSERRARRFSSLSRARAFAREVGGTIHRWRRTPPGGGQWQRVSPWQRALRAVSATRRLPKLYGMMAVLP